MTETDKQTALVVCIFVIEINTMIKNSSIASNGVIYAIILLFDIVNPYLIF